MSDYHKQLLENNRLWAEKIAQEDPDFFKELSQGQRPPFLWIGCADSRVPANQVTGMSPGDVFVHRNIANMVVHTDLNMLSVLLYAVHVLKVQHIIVCGHYGCGGVEAAMTNNDYGMVNKWLRHIKDVYHAHAGELQAIPEQRPRLRRLIELNVAQQVHNLAETSIVQRAWKEGRILRVHGWVYELSNGRLKDLDVTIDGVEQIDPIYRVNL